MISMTIKDLIDTRTRLPESKTGWVYLVGTKDVPLYVGKTSRSVKARMREHLTVLGSLGLCVDHFWPESKTWVVRMYRVAELRDLQPTDTPPDKIIKSINDAERFVMRWFGPELNRNGSRHVHQSCFQPGRQPPCVVTGIKSEVARWYWTECVGAEVEDAEPSDKLRHP